MTEQAVGLLGPSPPAAPEREAGRAAASVPAPRRRRGRLFYKYVSLVVTVVALALAANGAMEVWALSRDHKAALVRIQRGQAEAAAGKIEQFVAEIENQLGWMTMLPWTTAALDQRRFDAQRLLRQVPAITELSLVDGAGHEQLRVSRLAMDVVGSGADVSAEPSFAGAVANRVYHGPVYFRRGSEPYMTLALAGNRRGAGVAIAEVNLKFIWDVVSRIRVGEAGQAWAIDRQGRLIAHPDISLVLRKTDLSELAQVQAARASADAPEGGIREAVDLQVRPVLTAHAPVATLGWLVFVELPVSEAYAPLYGAIRRTALTLLAALVVAALAGTVLARRLVQPIRALTAGAERIGSGDLAQRIAIRTGDELETLAEQFNDMAARLAESYRNLEGKVEARTRDLEEALDYQTATTEILRVIGSSLSDAQPVFEATVSAGQRLFPGAAVSIALPQGDEVIAAAVAESDPVRAAAWRRAFPFPLTRDYMHSRAIIDGCVIDIPDVAQAPDDLGPGAGNFLGSGYRAVTILPLLRGERAIGALSVIRVAPGPLTGRQRDLLATFGRQAVIAIENARLFTELDARNRELTEALDQQTATGEVLKVMSRSQSDLKPVLEVIASISIQLCQADYAHIYKLEPDGNYYLVAARGIEEDYALPLYGRPFGAERGSLAGRAALERQTVHIPNIPEDPDYTLRIARQRTGLGVPLLRGETCIGVIVLLRTVVNPFTGAQIDLVTTFADQAVIAMENVRLFTELEARTRELTRSVEELRALDEVSQALSSTLDLETVLATIVSRAVALSGGYSGIVYEFDEADQVFRATAAHRVSEEHLEALRSAPVRLGEGAVGRAGLIRRPVQVPDIAAEGRRVAPQVRAIVEREGMRALVAVPLVRDDRVLGGLVILRDRAGEFSEETLDLVDTFAAHSVLAIQNARLFREIEEKGRQLAEASRHKSQFLANMSHELRTPLNAILGYTELILDGIYGEAPEKMLAVLERVQSNGKHLLGLINDVLDLSKIEAGQLALSLADYSLADVVQSVHTAVENLAAEKGIGFRVVLPPDLPVGHGDERRIAQVLLNLVGNAIKFTDVGEVTISATAADGAFRIAVSDTGPGISAADQARIFGEFQQADSSSTRKKGGTGLGLSISLRIVEMHGGRIEIASEPGQGATFTVTLPLAVEKQAAAQ